MVRHNDKQVCERRSYDTYRGKSIIAVSMEKWWADDGNVGVSSRLSTVLLAYQPTVCCNQPNNLPTGHNRSAIKNKYRVARPWEITRPGHAKTSLVSHQPARQVSVTLSRAWPVLANPPTEQSIERSINQLWNLETDWSNERPTQRPMKRPTDPQDSLRQGIVPLHVGMSIVRLIETLFAG